MLALVSSSCAFAPVVTPRASAPMMAEKSAAMPFMDKPAGLDGSMPGDIGFDPFGFSNHELGPFDTPAEHMAWMREAELKHGERAEGGGAQLPQQAPPLTPSPVRDRTCHFH